MSRIILIAMALAVTVAGCNRFPDNGLQITANLLPDNDCFVRGDQDERLLRGVYDIGLTEVVGIPSDYLVALKLESYLISNALEFQANQNNIQVDNYDITILLPDGSKPALPDNLVNPYRVTTSAVIPATTAGSTANEDVGVAIGIPGSYQQALVDLGVPSILLSIRAGGTTFGGFSQRSAPFNWPVDFCNGCLRNCDDPGSDDINTCLVGQDQWQWCELPDPAP